MPQDPDRWKIRFGQIFQAMLAQSGKKLEDYLYLMPAGVTPNPNDEKSFEVIDLHDNRKIYNKYFSGTIPRIPALTVQTAKRFDATLVIVPGFGHHLITQKAFGEHIPILKKLGFNILYAFYDDSFTLDMDRAYEICDEIIRRKLNIIWSCETRVNLVEEKLLKKMKQSGCYSISYGLESGSQEILDVIDKGTTLEQAEEAVRYTHEAGIHAIGYFMIGSPGETPDTIHETIRFAKKLKVDYAQFSITTPFPGTRLYDLYLEGGGRPDIPWEDYVYAASSEGSAPVFESDSLSREDIILWESKAYREFYLRPSYIWQRLVSCTSVGDIKVNLNGLSMLLSSIKSKKKKQ